MTNKSLFVEMAATKHNILERCAHIMHYLEFTKGFKKVSRNEYWELLRKQKESDWNRRHTYSTCSYNFYISELHHLKEQFHDSIQKSIDFDLKMTKRPATIDAYYLEMNFNQEEENVVILTYTPISMQG